MEFIENINLRYPTKDLNRNRFSNYSDSISAYKWFLNLEEQRSLRSRGVVCVLNIYFTNISTNHQGSKYDERFNKVWQKIMKSIITQTRISDIVFISEKQIKVILTNTLRDGAYGASKRFYKMILALIEKEPIVTKNLELKIELDIWDYNEKKKYRILMLENKISSELCEPIYMTM